MISTDQIRKFQTEGYIVLHDFFGPVLELRPLANAYTELLDALAAILIESINPELHKTYCAGTFAERLAMLFGLSGGTALNLLNPALGHLETEHYYSQQLNFPSAQIPEIFYLMRNKKLLDAIECLIGPEIRVSPSYNVHFKLSTKHINLVHEIARDAKKDILIAPELFNFYVDGGTELHADAAYSLPDAHGSDIIAAWIPMTEADVEQGSFSVVPGSHKAGVYYAPVSEELVRQAVPVETKPGDLILFHNKLVHGALPNESQDDVRWCFNFRYHPTGQSCGRPFLPGFVARSAAAPHKELHNPILWGEMWRCALRNLTTTKLPLPRSIHVTQQEVEEINAEWKTLIPDDLSWLRLGR